MVREAESIAEVSQPVSGAFAMYVVRLKPRGDVRNALTSA